MELYGAAVNEGYFSVVFMGLSVAGQCRARKQQWLGLCMLSAWPVVMQNSTALFLSGADAWVRFLRRIQPISYQV